MRLLFTALTAPLLMWAQTNTGSITGTVTDPQHSAVAGAIITAANLGTNIVESATSGSAGNYNISALQPGTYRITVELAGFKKLIREPIVVESSATAEIDLPLEVGSASSEITIEASTPIIQEASSTIQYNIDLKQISELPLANSSALSALALLPGVLGDPGVEQAAITTGLTTPGAGLSISGGAAGTVQFQADGVNNTSSYYGRIGLAFSTEAVSEIVVVQNSYSAEYRSAGGAIVNMTTKAGTNQLHGTIFSYTQNDILNAAPCIQRYWRGGFDIGGPVYIPKLFNGKNRTFFFAGYEPLRQYTRASAFARVATPAERQGDFSHSVYNTLTNQPIFIFQHFQPGTNTPIVEPPLTPYPQFPNNIIPPSLISPRGQKVLTLEPLPNMPLNALGQNYFVFRNVRNTDDRVNLKVDQVIASNNRASFRISEAPTKGVRYFQGGLAEQVPTDANTGTNAALSDTQIFGGNKVNELRLGFSRSNNQRRQTDQQLAQNGFQQFGFPSYLTAGMPQITGFGDPSVQNIASDPGAYQIDNQYQITDVFHWTAGKHGIGVGGEFNAPQQNIVDYQNVGGVWSFSQATTGIGSGNTATVLGIPNATTGSGLATILLGCCYSLSIPLEVQSPLPAGRLQGHIEADPQHGPPLPD